MGVVRKGKHRVWRFKGQRRPAVADRIEILHLNGEVTVERYRETRATLLGAITRNGRVSVDLSGVSYIDSAGIACLVEALQAARKRGGELRLLSAGTQVMQLLRLTRLDAVFVDRPAAAACNDAGRGVLDRAPAA